MPCLGVPFFDLFGTNKIGSIDPVTMAIKEYPLPDEASRPRRIAITSDDVIWYSESGVKPNTLVRFDPKTQKFQTWVIPSGIPPSASVLAGNTSGKVTSTCLSAPRSHSPAIGRLRCLALD